MKALHKGTLFSRWSSPGLKDTRLSRVMLVEEGEVLQCSLGQEAKFNIILFGSMLVSQNQLDITGLHLSLHRSDTLWFGFPLQRFPLWGSHWEGPSKETRSVKDSPYYFYRIRSDSASAIFFLVCSIQVHRFSSCRYSVCKLMSYNSLYLLSQCCILRYQKIPVVNMMSRDVPCGALSTATVIPAQWLPSPCMNCTYEVISSQ